MQKNYVYVVTASDQDYFSEMAAISIQSLRLSNPNNDYKVTVICDQQTIKIDTPGMRKIKTLSDQIIEVEAPCDTSIARSRYLKCSMINIMNQCFLYLDSDTLVLRSLDNLWNNIGDFDIAACIDISSKDSKSKLPVDLKYVYSQMEWGEIPDHYFNAGVMLFNHTANVKKLGQRLQTEWLKQYYAIGKVNDQYVINYLLHMMKLNIKILSYTYNAQLSMNLLVVKNAAVVHVYSGNFNTRMDTVLHVLTKKLKQTGEIDAASLKKMIVTGNPWTSMDATRKYIAVGNYLGGILFFLNRIRLKLI